MVSRVAEIYTPALPKPVLSLHLLELKSTFWRAKPLRGEAAGRTDVNQCERSDTQGNFVVTGDSYATSLSGEAGQRKSPLGIHGQAGPSRQTRSFHKPGFCLCHVPGAGAAMPDAARSSFCCCWVYVLVWERSLIRKTRINNV